MRTDADTATTGATTESTRRAGMRPVSAVNQWLRRNDVLGPPGGPVAAGGASVSSRRATLDEGDRVAAAVLAAFGPVYQYVFDTDSPDRLGAAVRVLLGACGGRAAPGVLNYHVLVDRRTGTDVGLFRLDAAGLGPPPWAVAGLVGMVPAVLIALRTVRLVGLLRRLRAVTRAQPPADPGDVRLTQLVIFEPYRGRGYGAAFVESLRQRAIKPPPAGAGARRVTLFARADNGPALALFARCGFSATGPAAAASAADPVAASGRAGDLILMECCGDQRPGG